MESDHRRSPASETLPLSGAQRRRLRGLAHPLKPLVAVGKSGLVEGSMREIESALDHHELIKVRLSTDRAQRRQWASEIATASGAELVTEIGTMVVLYRPASDPDRRRIKL